MKKYLFLLLSTVICQLSTAQNIGIGTPTPNASARLDVTSTSSDILVPRMSSLQRTNIATPAQGLLVYDTDTNTFWFYNSSAWTNLSVSASGGWLLTGNSGTNPSTHFLGTTDNQPLRWRVNNTWAGELHPATGNIFMGIRAGQNSNGYSNIAFGPDALKLNTNRSNLIAIGDSALFNNSTGQSLVAIGSNALYSNTTGNSNTSIGNFSLFSNTAAGFNTAIGSFSLYSQNYNGGGSGAWNSYNTAVGAYALYTNQPTSTSNGVSNTAIGAYALHINKSIN